jgi:hypothetical protein
MRSHPTNLGGVKMTKFVGHHPKEKYGFVHTSIVTKSKEILRWSTTDFGPRRLTKAGGGP